MKYLLVTMLFIVGCSHKRIDYEDSKKMTVYFGLLKYDSIKDKSIILKKAKRSYPFETERLLLEKNEAKCEFDISAFNDLVKAGEPLGVGIDLIVNGKKYFGLGEITPGIGNGIVQVGISKSYQCIIGWKELF